MMKTTKKDKTLRVLQLYNRLLKGEEINKVSFALEHDISLRAFDRDVEDLRLFLSEIHSNNELIYDHYNKIYKLTKIQHNTLDPMHLILISKILIDTKLLCKDEMIGLIDELLASNSFNVSPYVNNYILEQLSHYKGTTDYSILKIANDLIETISHNYDINLCLNNLDSNILEKTVSPLNLQIKDNSLYLICCDIMDVNQIYNIKIENITGFKILKTNYALYNKQRYYNKKGDK